METKPQAGKTEFALKAFDKLTLALGWDHRPLALIPSPAGAGWRGQDLCCGHKAIAGLLQMKLEHTPSYPQSQHVTADCHQGGVIGKVTFLGHCDTGQDPAELPRGQDRHLSAFLAVWRVQLASYVCERAIFSKAMSVRKKL